MPRRAPALYRLLLWLLPSESRRRDGQDLEAAFIACMERERDRWGRAGPAWAWVRSAMDVSAAAVILRVDARSTRQVAALSGMDTRDGDTLVMTLR
jgi:hypothetical protein